MIFSSYQFIFIFLIPAVFLFWVLKPSFRLGFLIAVSLLFYAQWNTTHLVLLLLSLLINYLFAILLQRSSGNKFILLVLVIVLNLTPLVFFKYSIFLNLSETTLLLPLAISFYTFQQIAFQVDLYHKKIELGSFRDYMFFVLFFPQLIAGPIVHYRQIISQVHAGALQRIEQGYVQTGILLFSMGLFKKVVLADQFMPIANNAFGHIETISSLTAWIGLMAYSFGIYFDFSAYTDMALGLGLLFGIRLPINFYSPYRAVNIIDFWRRWHITLSNFLKEYVYIPLGGNRKNEARVVLNLIITMTLGGIWHGAGWTFLLWGVEHGILLSLVHLKVKYFNSWKIPNAIGTLLTFIIVTLLWVLFNSKNITQAMDYYHLLFSFNGSIVSGMHLIWVCIGLFIVWFLPNSIDFSRYQDDVLQLEWWHGLIAAVLAFSALKTMAESPVQSFVYFNF